MRTICSGRILDDEAAEELVGSRLDHVVRKAILPDRDAAEGEQVGTISLGAGSDLVITWTRSGADGWIGAIALPERRATGPVALSLRRDELTGLADRSSLKTVVRVLLGLHDGTAPSIVTACIDLV